MAMRMNDTPTPVESAPAYGQAQAARQQALSRGSGKESAVFNRAQLRKQRGGVERTTAWLVLLVSFVGSIAALTPGGWASIVAREFAFAAIGGGILIQLVLTFLEWYYTDNPLVSWPARVVDAYLTAIGYGPLVIAWLTGALVPRAGEHAAQAAWIIIGIIALLIAWYPENRLVD